MRRTLVCPECGGVYSANPAGYFWMMPGDHFECSECEEPLALLDENEEVIVLEATIEDLEGE